MSTLSKAPYVTMTEAVYWLGTGSARTPDELLGDVFEKRVKPNADHRRHAELDDAARDILRAHSDGDLTLLGHHGAGPVVELPRDVAASRVTFNPFANCIICPSASVKLWGNIRARTTEIEGRFRARASDALRGNRDRDNIAYACERWLFENMEPGHPPTKPKREWRKDATLKFGIGPRPFDAAWERAVLASGNKAWSRAGAPKKSKRKIEAPKKS